LNLFVCLTLTPYCNPFDDLSVSWPTGDDWRVLEHDNPWVTENDVQVLW